uniref:Uncharacterized protein n=1 Tax=Anguilla anguilla TaxID=7936 RepID=A0A0E9SQV6_ANGAN
MTTQSPEVH